MINLRGIVRIVLAGSAALAVAAGLTACTSGAEPLTTFTPTPTASEPSVEPSPTPTMTEEERLLALIPEEAKGDDLYAAEAMAKFFLTLHPKLYRGDDPALWQFLCLPESVFCSSNLESAIERKSLGELQVGGDIQIPDQLPELALDERDGIEFALVGLSVSQDALKIVDSAGEPVGGRDPQHYRVALALRYVDGLWRVHGVEVV